MAQQLESKIEDYAFDYLKNYYTQQFTAENVFVSQHEQTKRGQQIDGLLTFKRPADELFVANISMEQSQQLAGLLTNYKKNGLGKLRFLTPLLVSLICFAIGRSMGNVVVMFIAPVVVAPVSFMLHTYLIKKFRNRQVETIIEKVRTLPANEKWIGLSMSSLVFRNNPLAKFTLELCHEKGLGLISVGKRNKVVLLQRPTNKESRRGDYLSHYNSEDNIRRAINENHVLRVA